ncbi:MAG: addiction module protein [Betaproteobacteria bacterium]|nr:addiction module protein [Betaproteobacteria bacterium]
MQAETQNLFEQVKHLPPDEQIELADLIYAQAPLSSSEWEAAWVEEAERRIDAYERGEIPVVAAQEMRARVKARLGMK